MKTEITEGNWRVGDNGHTIFGPQTDSLSPEIVATMGTRQTFRGNAHLIAAAPELLEACKMAVSRLATLHEGSKLVLILDKAIAKAEGKS